MINSNEVAISLDVSDSSTLIADRKSLTVGRWFNNGTGDGDYESRISSLIDTIWLRRYLDLKLNFFMSGQN